MSKFAKLFERGDDQVLIRKGKTEDERPALLILFELTPYGFDSEMAISFSDTDSGWEAMEKAFDSTNEEGAWAAVETARAEFSSRLEG